VVGKGLQYIVNHIVQRPHKMRHRKCTKTIIPKPRLFGDQFTPIQLTDRKHCNIVDLWSVHPPCWSVKIPMTHASLIDFIFLGPVSGTCVMQIWDRIRLSAPIRTLFFYSKPESGVHVTEMIIYDLFVFNLSLASTPATILAATCGENSSSTSL